MLDRVKTVAERCMQAEPVLDRDGKATGEFTFNATGANKSLKLFGKHLGLFPNKHELAGKDGGPIQARVIIVPAKDPVEVPEVRPLRLVP